MNIPSELKYTAEHEWVKVEGDIALVGITDFAQSELGDIVFVEVDAIGEELDKDEPFGTIEAVKTVSDLFMPLTGEVLELNEKLEAQPEIVNQDPYGEGWFVKIKFQNADEIEQLLSADEYKAKIGA